MVALTCIIACLGLFADARSTRIALLEGFYESNPVRRFLIRVLGLNGGTYGVATAMSAGVVSVNLLSRQPTWALATGNLIMAAICFWAYYKNAEAI